MAEYIKRDDALRQVMMVETRENMYQCVKNIPAADVQPVVHGKWELDGEPPWYIRECSECGEKWHHWHGYELPNYCSNCGARMDGET